MGTAAPRGEHRRQEILAGSLRLLARGGVAAVTHRAVAAEAAVPLAATTYYFDSKEDLIRQALRALVAEEVARLEAVAASFGDTPLTPDVLAHSIVEVLCAQFVEPSDARAKFEVYLEASRRLDLRKEVGEWVTAFRALAERTLAAAGAADPEDAAEVLVAGVDGILLHAIVTGEGRLRADALTPPIRRLVSALLAAPRAR